jgi:hypothetical protein
LEKVEIGHGIGTVVLIVQYDPAGHTLGMIVPGELQNFLGGHAMHVDASAAMYVDEYVPLGQLTGCTVPAGQYVP